MFLRYLLGLWVCGLLVACDGIDSLTEDPTSPRGVTYARQGSTLAIDWIRVNRASSYDLYVYALDDTALAQTLLIRRQLTTTGYVLEDFDSQRDYRVEVTATVNGQESSPSEPLYVRLGTVSPSLPIGPGTLVQNQRPGMYQFQLSKLDDRGRALPVTAENWNCVADAQTGLVWEGKTNAGLNAGSARFGWYEENAQVNGGSVGGRRPVGASCRDAAGRDSQDCGTLDHVQRLNSVKHCGYSDWRMPALAELVSIMRFNNTDLGLDAPPLAPDYFSATQPGTYWSATPYAASGQYEQAWVVDFHPGLFNQASADVGKLWPFITPEHKNSAHALMLVRGPALADRQASEDPACRDNVVSHVPQARFSFHQGIALDNHTGLAWSQCPGGSTYRSGVCDDLERATQTPDSLHGRNGWRLPNIKELLSVMEYQCAAPALPAFLRSGFDRLSIESQTALLKTSTSVSGLPCDSSLQCQNALGLRLQDAGLVFYTQTLRDDYPALMVRTGL